MPVVKTKGSASSQGFGEFAQQGGGGANYIDDVFSTYLYTGNGSTQTITNNIDLSTKGGLTWIKWRSSGQGYGNHELYDTNRGATKAIDSASTNAQTTRSGGLTSFNSDGFSLGSFAYENGDGNFASWTFAKQEKFFDVQTFTTTYNNNPNVISHNLNGELGCAIFKQLNSTGQGINWIVYHRSLGTGKYLKLNTTDSTITDAQSFVAVNNTAGTISFGYPMSDVNDRLVVGNTETTNWVGYFFAHNAGGFGTSGTDNVISCGSYTGNGSASNLITLGYEPQWVLLKRTDITGDWGILDNMRGWSYDTENVLKPNSSAAEDTGNTEGNPTATGFDVGNGNYNVNTRTYIYIAIRRPMKPPTTGTSVYYSEAVSQADTQQTSNVPFPLDLTMSCSRNGSSTQYRNNTADRLRGLGTPNNSYSTSGPVLYTYASDAEVSPLYMQLKADSQNITRGTGWNSSAYGNYVYWNFKRASTFFDEVCYTGTGSATAFNHNLTVVPELIIIKKRSAVSNWFVGYNFTASTVDEILLDSNAASDGTYNYNDWFGAAPTSTTFTPYVNTGTNSSTYVAYLFATVAGVSKVGSYTGTGTVTQTINAGFGASGARWVLIKRTDSTGDWYVFDTARGFTSTSSPYLRLNSTAAEVTGNNGCYAASTGFTLTTNASTTVNVNGGSYIYLAVA